MSAGREIAFLSDHRSTPRSRDGSDTRPAVVSPIATPLGDNMLTRYCTHLTRRRQSPQTIRLRRYYVAALQAVHADLALVTTDDLELYIERHPNWSENTEATAVASWRSFYGWAHGAGLVVENPAADLAPVRVARRPGRIATEDQIGAALERAQTDPDRAMILLGAECGLRASEIASLRVSDLDGAWLTVTGKGNKVRALEGSPELVALLNGMRHRARWGYFFPGRSGGHMHPSTVWRHIDSLLDLNPHSLRHRAGTVCYEGTGYDLRATQEFLGHASIRTTEIYVHVGREALQRAARATRIARAA